MCIFLARFLNDYVQIKLENGMCIFIELTSFKRLFLVKFPASTLDESHLLLAKFSCKTFVKISMF